MKYAIGTKVKVVLSNPEDETMDTRFGGKVGIVKGYNTNNETGNTEEDPLHKVELDKEQFWDVEGTDLYPLDALWEEEVKHPLKEQFWYEELREEI